MIDAAAVQVAISELLRAAELCLSSTHDGIRGVGVMLMIRATGLAEGKIDPEVLDDAAIDRISDLLIAVTDQKIQYTIPWADRLYLVK